MNTRSIFLLLAVSLGACASDPPILAPGTYTTRITTAEASGCPPFESPQAWEVLVQTQYRSILDIVETSHAFSIYTMRGDGIELVGEVDGNNTGGDFWGTSTDGSWFGQLEIHDDRTFSAQLLAQREDCTSHYQLHGSRE